MARDSLKNRRQEVMVHEEQLAGPAATRRIDDIGRVVIPKSIRAELGIEEGDLLNIFVISDGVVIKKAEPEEE